MHNSGDKNENHDITHGFYDCAEEIARVGRFLATQGWSPATSSNYSVRFSKNSIAINRSGVDKYVMSPGDFMIVDLNGAPTVDDGTKPSAETLIHTAIYQVYPEIRAVLHTHSPYNTRLSLKYADIGQIQFEGYELQKGLEGIETHEGNINIPILANSQNMTEFSDEVKKLLLSKSDLKGFLISGHGLYTWGRSLNAAKRHVETFEFLFACRALELMGV